MREVFLEDRLGIWVDLTDLMDGVSRLLKTELQPAYPGKQSRHSQEQNPPRGAEVRCNLIEHAAGLAQPKSTTGFLGRSRDSSDKAARKRPKARFFRLTTGVNPSYAHWPAVALVSRIGPSRT